MKIAIIGEYDSAFEPHARTNAALEHSAAHLNVDVNAVWISTADITTETIDNFGGVWIAPGSPYRDMTRALDLIYRARTTGRPCLGTCGGFQHMVIEYARNVLGIEDAAHAAYDPYASRLIVNKLQCSLVGQELKVKFAADSLVAKIYGSTTASEHYYCNFCVNPAFTRQLADGGFVIVGSDSDEEPRVMQVTDHCFFIGTLFVPHSTVERPHPLVTGFLKAVLVRNGESLAVGTDVKAPRARS